MSPVLIFHRRIAEVAPLAQQMDSQHGCEWIRRWFIIGAVFLQYWSAISSNNAYHNTIFYISPRSRSRLVLLLAATKPLIT